jgi:hypothetical protein
VSIIAVIKELLRCFHFINICIAWPILEVSNHDVNAYYQYPSRLDQVTQKE